MSEDPRARAAADELIRTAPDSMPWHPPAGMVDAHPPRRHGRYCRYTAHPQRDRPLLHIPRFRAGAGIACQRPPGAQM